MLKGFGIFILILLLAPGPVLGGPTEGQDPDAYRNMVPIPGGAYVMGSRKSLHELQPMEMLNPDRHMLGPENSAHKVDIDAFYMDIYEVTNAEYQQLVKATGARQPAFMDNADFNGPRQPVVGVSWKEAAAFCQWKNKRLPTEAEWEKASRGKRSILFPWGDEEPDNQKLNYNNEHQKPLPVGSFEADKSDYGVYDLAGNVGEWVNDWHMAEFYMFSPLKNPQGPKKRPYKVFRGGHWMSPRYDVRTVFRNASVPKMRTKIIGFRCAKDTAPGP